MERIKISRSQVIEYVKRGINTSVAISTEHGCTRCEASTVLGHLVASKQLHVSGTKPHTKKKVIKVYAPGPKPMPTKWLTLIKFRNPYKL